MHHALKIHEIIQEVCEYIEISRTGYSPLSLGGRLPGNQWMTALALVCRAWFEPAMDIKWAKLYDLAAFVEIWVARGVLEKNGRSQYMLKRQPSDDDWCRFFQYSKRLKHICGTRSSSNKALLSLFLNAPKKLRMTTHKILNDANSNMSDRSEVINTPIFPSLRTISCTIEAPKDTSLTVMLIRNAPRLSKFALTPDEYVLPSIPRDLLPLLHQKQLTELELPCLCSEEDERFIPWVVEFLGTCLSLEKLQVCSELISDPSFIKAASNHQHIASITFADSYDHHVPQQAPPHDFPRLKNLTLDHWSARNLLVTCRFAQLTSLSIGRVSQLEHNVWDAIYHCLQLIGRNCLALRSLQIEPSSWDNDEWFNSLSAPQSAGSFLRPLIQCNQLEEMKIDVTFPTLRRRGTEHEVLYRVPDEFNLSNEDYESIASALPNLLIFNYYLGYSHSSEYKARPHFPKPVATIKTLDIFAFYCTKLLELHIPIDCSAYVTNPVLPLRSFKALKTLALHCSVFPSSQDELDAVATALKTIIENGSLAPKVRLVGPTCRDWPDGVEEIKGDYEVHYRPPHDVIVNCNSWAKIHEQIADPRRKFEMALMKMIGCNEESQLEGEFGELFRAKVSMLFDRVEGKNALEWS